ncbi:MAG: hypothetical protein K2X81_11280, partial [Candidatus Obscuribacterales bacterium]|nr:hypothetical protein [Candidatus Obscuribacterales bacterium]
EQDRAHVFSRKEISDRGDNLDISWLQAEEINEEDQLSEPDEILAAIAAHLKNALEEVESLADELEQNGAEQVSV